MARLAIALFSAVLFAQEAGRSDIYALSPTEIATLAHLKKNRDDAYNAENAYRQLVAQKYFGIGWDESENSTEQCKVRLSKNGRFIEMFPNSNAPFRGGYCR